MRCGTSNVAGQRCTVEEIAYLRSMVAPMLVLNASPSGRPVYSLGFADNNFERALNENSKENLMSDSEPADAAFCRPNALKSSAY